MSDKKTALWVVCLVAVGLLVISALSCILPDVSWWDVFCGAGTVLGFCADITIIVAIYTFLKRDELDIKGIGKIRVSRKRNNIQDVTNLISCKLYDGGNFERKSVLEAMYEDSDITILETYEGYESLKGNNPDRRP